MKKPSVLAIIPARGGSKSIPYKNIYPILGKPLIAWTILEARKAKLIDRVVVSTDDEKIARVAKRYGAEVPFMRPKRLAGDRTPDLPVFQHAIQWHERNEGYRPDVVVHLWATSPLRIAGHIDAGVRFLLKHPEADSVRTVTLPSQTPFKMWMVKDIHKPMQPLLAGVFPELFRKRWKPYMLPRQVLPKVFVQDGYFHAFWTRTLIAKKSMFGGTVLPFIVPSELYSEFDAFRDLMHTEYLMREYRGGARNLFAAARGNTTKKTVR